MLNRRTLFGSVAGTLSALSVALGRSAQAKTAGTDTAVDFEPRGKKGRLERMASLDAECRNDFLTGVRNWRGGKLVQASSRRMRDVLAKAGVDASKDVPLETILELVEGDPVIGLEGRIRIDAQRMAHANYIRSFDNNREAYLQELDAYDNRGPGTLELNPDLVIPDYARHEIHMQPGGYVGHPFAGAIYHYGTNAFYEARGTWNYNDEHSTKLARQVALPADGQVKRILDIGCGIGQLTMGLKEVHPNAEVWGLDCGAPMVRYGHMRAVDAGLDVNFAQRLAEDTKFTDGYFDVITSNIFHHELPAHITEAVFAEVSRILRPGGVYAPHDFYTGGHTRRRKSAFSTYQTWKDHRWNNEVWRIEYEEMDFYGAMETAGLIVDPQGPALGRNRTNVLATKPS